MAESNRQKYLRHVNDSAAHLCVSRKWHIENSKAFRPDTSVARRAFYRGSFAWSSYFLGTDELGDHNLLYWLRTK